MLHPMKTAVRDNTANTRNSSGENGCRLFADGYAVRRPARLMVNLMLAWTVNLLTDLATSMDALLATSSLCGTELAERHVVAGGHS